MASVIISIDESKYQIEGYVPSRAEEFHVRSARIADKRFKESLKNETSKKVVLMSGGSASGKTEFVSEYLKNFDGIVFDRTLSSIEGARVKIRNTRRKNKVPVIYAIWPDDIKRAFIAFLHRDRKFSDEHFYRTHSGSRSTLLWIASEYPDIEIVLHESSFNRKNGLVFKRLKFSSNKERFEYIGHHQYSEEDLLEMIKTL